MNPRVIAEYDENEEPGLLHAVRRSTATKGGADASSLYQTMCGEILFSASKYISRKRGVPTCVRCVLALIEEVFSEPRFLEVPFP